MSSFLTYLSIAAKGIKAGCSTLNKGKATRIRLTKARNLFTPFVVEVITGIMLGDSCVRHQKGCIDAYLYVEQKDAEFVQLLWNYFNTIGIVGAEPHTRCRTDKRPNNTYTSTLFATFTHPFFTEMFQLWYHSVDEKDHGRFFLPI